MEHKSSESRTVYKGRSGEGRASAPGRPTGAFRTQPSGVCKARSEYARTRGDSEYMPARGSTSPRNDHTAGDAPQNSEAVPAKRRPKKRGLRIGLIIAIIAAALAIALIFMFTRRAPLRMLPTVTPPEAAQGTSAGEGA